MLAWAMWKLSISIPTCSSNGTWPRAGWISTLLLEWLRNAVEPPGPRTATS